MEKKIKIICLYQVIMHYRKPFYEKLSNDIDYDFKIFYGNGKNGTKLKNTDISDTNIIAEKLYDIRIPLPFSPKLLYKLVIENPDIILSEGSSSLINGSIAFIYSKVFNKKFVWWSLGTLRNDKKKGIRKIISYWEKVIENNSDAIFTYSTQGKNYFLYRGVKENKIFIGVNVFDTTKKLDEINHKYIENYIDKNYFNISFIGTIQKTKNLELLIDVVKGLNKSYNKSLFKLHIIGDGEYFDTIKKYSSNDENIVLYGRINNGTSKILKNSDVLVLPGLGGLAIPEGMLNELPIISGQADGTELDLVDENNGFIIENMNYENLYDKIEFYHLNPDIKKIHGKNSFKKITNEFSFENYYSNFKKLINSIK